MQSKSTFLEFFDVYSSLLICPPRKILQGRNLFRVNDVISIEHMLCSQESSFTFCLASCCASLSSLTFSSRLVCFLVEFWTVLPCLFMFTNTIAYAFRSYVPVKSKLQHPPRATPGHLYFFVMFHYFIYLFIYLFFGQEVELTNFNIIFPKNYRTWKLIIYLT